MDDADVVVIGGGSAGYAAARAASEGRARVVVVEGARELGGLCILRGCMPTKAMLESSHRWREIRRAGEFGLKVRPIGPDLRGIIARKDHWVGQFAAYRKKQLEGGRFSLVRGKARFLDAHTLEIQRGSTKTRLRARAFVLATGSEIRPIELPGLREIGCLTSDDVIKLTRLPRSLIVLGGGSIGVEFVQFFQDLGVRTTLIQRSDRLVRDFDPEVSEALRASFVSEGVKVYTGTQLIRASAKNGKRAVTFLHQGRTITAQAEEILFALGRQPAVRQLNLGAVGLPEGVIEVDGQQRTAVPHVFAAGDVASRFEVVHIAIQQGEIAGRQAARTALGESAREEPVDYRLKMGVVFTQPEIASVGLSEEEARDRGLDYAVASYPFNDHGKSMIMGAGHGFVKLVAEKSRGEIIGAQIIGPHASELIHELSAVMFYRGTVADLLRIPHYHPTLAEIVTYPAEELASLIPGSS